MPYKRKMSSKGTKRPAKRLKTTSVARAARNAQTGVRRLWRMIETKESVRVSSDNVAVAHNNLQVIVDPFNLTQGVTDGMNTNSNRIGDRISVKGCLITGFLENAAQRPKVYFRVMLTRSAKGDVITRDTLFKGNSANKMIDQVDTDRYTILAQKVLNVEESNPAWATLTSTGTISSGLSAGIGTRTFKMWIPGRKFGRGGVVQYENNSVQTKFFDYRVVVVCYDWYGTPQDVNTVGRINSCYAKLYFKDA